jgi:hypothetical protein
MIGTNVLHPASIDGVEVGIMSSNSISCAQEPKQQNVKDTQEVEETIGEHLERHKVSLYYYYQLNMGSLYQTSLADANLT